MRRTATLDDFISAAREAASQVRSGSVDVEAMISRLADAIVEKSSSRLEAVLRERCGGGLTEDAVRSIVREVVSPILSDIVKRLEALEKKVEALHAALASSAQQNVHRSEGAGAERLPGWARRIARKLETLPYVRLHEENIDVYTVKSSVDVLRKLGTVLVETPAGVYLVKRSEWLKLLEALAGIKTRDEEAALRRAGPLAEVVAALLRSNLLYYNNGWRVLRDAYLDPVLT